MRTVWKYQLVKTMGEQRVTMPDGANVVHVGIQQGNICLWAMVDAGMREKERVFHVVATGEEFPLHGASFWGGYRGTVQDEEFVWHVFEKVGSA